MWHFNSLKIDWFNAWRTEKSFILKYLNTFHMYSNKKILIILKAQSIEFTFPENMVLLI